MNIFVISDTHHNHKNIIKYEKRPENHKEIIIQNWNRLVKPTDLVIHLGDVIFGEDQDLHLIKIMEQLNGRKILTRGNHDEHDWVWYMEKGFDFVCDYFVYKNIAFSHAPITPLPPQGLTNDERQVEFNVHGHFHRGMHRNPENNAHYVDGYYNFQYWKANKEKYKLVQIEDEFRPFSLEEILL